MVKLIFVCIHANLDFIISQNFKHYLSSGLFKNSHHFGVWWYRVCILVSIELETNMPSNLGTNLGEYWLFWTMIILWIVHQYEQQQYHVVPFRIGLVRVKMGLGLTGKLGRAWYWCMGWMGFGVGINDLDCLCLYVQLP